MTAFLATYIPMLGIFAALASILLGGAIFWPIVILVGEECRYWVGRLADRLRK